jgi:hypothetical protein
MKKIYMIAAFAALLVVILVSIPIYNRYFRKQVYLVSTPVGNDTTPCPLTGCSTGCPNSTPSNLPAMQQVATQYNAEIATGDQVGDAAAAGAQVNQWGWMSMGTAYIAGFPAPQGGIVSQEMATALGCNDTALQVNPCLSSLVPNGVSTCGSSPAGMTYTYDSNTSSINNADDPTKSFNCYNGNLILDTVILQPTGSTQCYVYNPSNGVWVYGIKPAEGSDPNVVPFNGSQYSQFGLFSL